MRERGVRCTGMEEASPLDELAGLYGLDTAFYDGLGELRRPPMESVFAVLRSLGAPLDSWAGVGDAVRERRTRMAGVLIEPVVKPA